MRKRGVFFSIIAIMLVLILTIAFTPLGHISYKDRIPSISGRINAGNNYVKSIKEGYFKSAVETSGRGALVALTLLVNKTTYLPDYGSVNSTFIELMINGSVNGTPIECYLDNKPLAASDCMPVLNTSYSVMRNRTLLFRLSQMENASRDVLLIETEFRKSMDGYYARLFQDSSTGPWGVGVTVSSNYTVDASVSHWNISQNLTVIVPVEGILDPVYLVNASFNNTIVRSNSTVWDAGNLSMLVEDMKYVYEPTAPSFLMRLYYNLSNGGGSVSGSTCCGIESPVNPNRLNIPKCTKKSYIDWCFYNRELYNCTGGMLFNINGVTTYVDGNKYIGFKLDLNHSVVTYNLSASDLAAMGACP
ncbi:hypothetical protein HYU11_01765 [Candidatus Woesearchaeota archaeon]|nr:hypothetical protein [Candidatus Woesearchaeota archaeon]